MRLWVSHLRAEVSFMSLHRLILFVQELVHMTLGTPILSFRLAELGHIVNLIFKGYSILKMKHVTLHFHNLKLKTNCNFYLYDGRKTNPCQGSVEYQAFQNFTAFL